MRSSGGRAHGQGRNNKLQHNLRPALEPPPARKSVTDKGNAKKQIFV